MAAVAVPELDQFERLLAARDGAVRVRDLGAVDAGKGRLRLLAAILGSERPEAPTVGFFAGVHGVERIGSQVLLSFLGGLLARLRWDPVLQHELEQVRLLFMPVVNPGGMWHASRSNPRGVDLMRNAPLDAREKVAFMAGGQRLSRRLPWFRGASGEPMEAESAALCTAVREYLLPARFSLALDCHSGFGLRDRIWFPYAHTAAPIPHLAEVGALEQLFNEACPHHPYLFEPQSRQYLTHGDLWDYLYLEANGAPGRIFLPLTLEMGSWMWVRKRPSQLLSWQGLFNPLAPHRQHRVLRRHLAWMDFLVRAACAHRRWLPQPARRRECERQALARWYPGAA